MLTYEYGDMSARDILVQPVDDHDLEMLENEVQEIGRLNGRPFGLVAVKVDNWNTDLSPWKAPAVFGKEDFGEGADRTLLEITKLCAHSGRNYYIGGYSLAGLFSLWAAYNTDLFKGVAAASPSVWFPGFAEYMEGNAIKSPAVYLSLGDREEKTRNPVMATVGDRIRQAYALLNGQGVRCVLKWNQGNHFKDASLRTAKAFAWLLEQD